MYNNEELNAIQNTRMGFEFEFFSNKKVENVKQDLIQLLNKRIHVEDDCHSDFQPNSDVFKIEPDRSGGTGMIEFITGPLPYPEAKLTLAKTLKYIRENGYTTDRSSIHCNISFNLDELGDSCNISKLDIGKYILRFDEEFVYKLFPNRRDSVYAKSIKYMMPYEMTMVNPGFTEWTNYLMAQTKYYGINFSKLPKSYIEYRYMGGKDYCKKYSDIVTLMEYFVVSLYHCLNDDGFTEKDKEQLAKTIEQHKVLTTAIDNYANFKSIMKDIGISVDLITDEQRIVSFWERMKPKLYEIVIQNGMKNGIINYDSDTGRLQIKDAKFNDCFEMNDIDVVECDINQGNLTRCDIFNSTIRNSNNLLCNMFDNTNVISSKLEDCYVSKGVNCDDCYVFGKKGIFSGFMKGPGIFREGRVTKFAKFEKSVEVIEKEKI